MATSAQARFERLFKNKPKPAVTAKDGPSFAEKELLEAKQKLETPNKPPTPPLDDDVDSLEVPDAELDDFVLAQAPSKLKMKLQTSRGRHTESLRPQGHIPGTSPSQVVFIPGGKWQGGLCETRLDDADDEDDREPVSSSNELNGRFCIFSLVAKFPYKYMQDPGDAISRRFFAKEKIYERKWSMHYIYAPEDCGSKPIMLVPVGQVQALLDEISTEFKIKVKVPRYPFQLSFYNDGTPQPRSLGTVDSKSDMLDLQATMPDPPPGHDQPGLKLSKVQQQDYAAWREKAERAFEAEKKKKSAMKKKIQKRDMTIMENCDQLKRAQRYLGLRQKLPSTTIVQPETSPDEQQKQQLIDVGFFVNALDTSKVAPFAFEDQPVIVCVDVESWEMQHSIITEIGVSTLDTVGLVNLAPGNQGEEWIKKIRSRHFRIKGREGLKNFKFCHGNPDKFQFGTSEFVSVEQAAEAVDSCFEYPYSAGFECAGPTQTDADGFDAQRAPATLKNDHQLEDAEQPRNLLLVGHDINNDITYLSTLGSTIFGSPQATSTNSNTSASSSRRHKVLSSIRERLDTAILHKSLKKDDQPWSLMKICHELDITAWYAHNAGNDARYTLEAFVKLVIKARLEEDAAIALAKETRNSM